MSGAESESPFDFRLFDQEPQERENNPANSQELPATVNSQQDKYSMQSPDSPLAFSLSQLSQVPFALTSDDQERF